MSTIIPNLDLVNINDGDLEEYALDKVEKFTAAGALRQIKKKNRIICRKTSMTGQRLLLP